MTKYRKKPITIEAFQWFPEMGEVGGVIAHHGDLILDHGAKWLIETLEGYHIVSPGDWIITGVKGEKYPCKADIFELTYDKVDDDND